MFIKLLCVECRNHMLQLPVHITCRIIVSTHSATLSRYNVTYLECICIMLKKDQTLVTQLCGTEQSYILCRNIRTLPRYFDAFKTCNRNITSITDYKQHVNLLIIKHLSCLVAWGKNCWKEINVWAVIQGNTVNALYIDKWFNTL